MSSLARITSNGKLKLIALSLFFLALTLFLFRNIFDGAYLTGTDSMSTIYDSYMQAASGFFFSAWDWFSSAGVLSYPLPAYAAFNALFVGVLQLPAYDFVKLQLLGSFWLAGMLSFYVLRRMTSSDKAAFLGSLVYIGNGAFMNQVVEGHISFVMAYPFLILIFYLFHDAYNNGITKKTIALPAILLIYGGAAAPHMVLLAAVMIISYVAADIMYSIISRRRERMIYKVGVTALLSFVVVIPIAYTMLVLGGSSMFNTAYTLEEAGDISNTFLGAIVLGGAELTNTYSYYGPGVGMLLVNVTQLLALPLFFFALLSLFVDRYRKWTVPIWIAIAFNIFMSMGPTSPLGFVFTFMFDNVPLIDSFRALSRFAMINAVFYSVLITITVANWKDIVEKARRLKEVSFEKLFHGRWRGDGSTPSKEFSAALAAILVVASLSGLAVIVNGDVIKGFEVPREYAEPFEYIEGIDADGQYYKIYTLPMIDDVYQHPYILSLSGYGYPRGTTIDPGTYLPTMINGRGMSHSLSTPDYWAGMNAIMEDRYFGYQRTLDLLGASAAVKYVVDQWYAPVAEKDHISNMSDGAVLVEYPSGARVILVNSFSSPLKAQGGLIVGSGGLESMYLLLGAGIFDPSNNTYASFKWLGDSVDEVLDASDLIVLQNGDLIELGYELGYMDDVLLHLSDMVNEHRRDSTAQWVLYTDQGTGEESITTSAANTLTVRPNAQTDAQGGLMIRALFGPDQGVLRVTVNGEIDRYIDLYAPFSGMEWVSVELPEDIERIESITFIGSSYGRPVTVSDAAIFTEESKRALVDKARTLLEPYGDRVGYSYTPLNIYLSDPSVLKDNWTLGSGIRSMGDGIDMTIDTIFDNAFQLSIYAPDWGARGIQIDGATMSGEGFSSGAYRYNLSSVAAGEHELQVFPDGLYGITLLPEYDSNMVAPVISFERISPTEYRISVTGASGPFILKFSEGVSEYWELNADGADTTWFRSDYLANAFIVNGTGDFEMTLVFSKQADYEAFLYVYAFAIITSTLVAAAAYAYTKISLNDKRKRSLDAERDR